MLKQIVLVTVAAAMPFAASAQVLVPEGMEGSILHIEADGIATRRIGGLDNIHGLSVAPNSGLIIAGSLSESLREDAETVSRPAGVSEEDHEAHHGGAKGKTADSDSFSIVTILDLASHDVRARIEVPGAVHHVEVSSDEQFAAVTHPGLDGISIIELETGTVNTIDTGPVPEYAIADPQTGYFLVSNAGNGTISEVDPSRGVVLRNFVIDGGPKHMQLTTKRRLVVAEADEGMVSVIDVTAGTVNKRYKVGGELHGIQSDGTAIYVVAREREALVRIDFATGKQFEKSLGPEPYHATLVGDALYVSSAAEPMIWIVDPSNLETIGQIKTNGVAHQMAPLPAS